MGHRLHLWPTFVQLIKYLSKDLLNYWITNPAAVFLPYVSQDVSYSIPESLLHTEITFPTVNTVADCVELWDVAKTSKLNITETKTAFLALNWPLQIFTSDSQAAVNILVTA